MLRPNFLGLLLLILGASAQDLECPDTFPEECLCYEKDRGVEVACVTVATDTWDIKTTFDAIAAAFNNTDAVVYSATLNSNLVTTPVQEVPAYSVSTLKTHNLFIYLDSKCKRIDPDAFSGSYSVTQNLAIVGVDFQDSEEAFDLFNNFQVLDTLQLHSFAKLSEIPPYAFDNDLKNLDKIIMLSAGLHSIGDRAFAALPNLMNVIFEDNKLTLANISDTAFTFVRTGVLLNLERNPGITHLPEEKFGNFLRGNENMIYVGYESTCGPTHFLQCDDRIDWICDAGVTRIYGYYCAEAAYIDIYDYCEQNFGNSPLYGENLEEINKSRIADRLRYETIKMEEEFHRRSYAVSKAKRQSQIEP